MNLLRVAGVAAAASVTSDTVMGPHLLAELYSISKERNLTAAGLEKLAHLDTTSTTIAATTTTSSGPIAGVTCAYRHTSKCDVSALFASDGLSAGSILLLGLAPDCSSAVFSTYSLKSAAVELAVPVLAQDCSYRLCYKPLATGRVEDRGEIRFRRAPAARALRCTPASTGQSRAKFMSLFNSVQCKITTVDDTDDGYYFTSQDGNCAALAEAGHRNLKCGSTNADTWCTLNLSKFSGNLTLCRCDGPIVHSNETLAVIPCQPEGTENIAVLQVANEVPKRLLAATSAPPATSTPASVTTSRSTTTRGSINLKSGGKVLAAALDGTTLKIGTCNADADCGTYGRCQEKQCAGFYADREDTKLIRCVEGYRCDVAGEISGVGINSNFQVIGVSPGEVCGTAEPLPAKLSIFSNPNRWRCSSAGSSQFCQFSPGVGQRRNKTIALEGLRLCGCPAADVDGNKVVCDSPKDFYVPLAKLGVQECLTNAHCLHKTFAYCVSDHCAGFMGIAASAGMKAYQCLLNKSCSVQSIAAKTINEGLKIVPVAASFNCGAEQALDADFYKENSLPCIMDINGDGRCDIHLGVPRALGTNRLCGCNGSDRGGNGRACDEPEDFDVDLGLLTVDECNIDADCAGPGVCVAKKCYIDTQAPYAVAIKPSNGTEVVPPVTELRITFSETVRFSTTQTDRRLVLMSPTNGAKYELRVADPTQHMSAADAHRIRIEGRDLVVTPDLRLNSLPEGDYVLGFEGGVVEDLQGNGNIGSTDFAFSVTSDGGCPFLGVTGFSIDAASININGIYRSTGILNSRPKWTSILPTIDGLNDNSQVFWYPGTAQTSGRWVIGLSHDHTKFLSYLDVPFPTDETHPSTAMRPQSGSWKKWLRGKWLDQRNVIVECVRNRVTSPPRFVDTDPLPGAVGITPRRLEMSFSFDRPVTYGHWSQISIQSVTPKLHEVVIDPEDEEHVRNVLLFRDLTNNQMHLRLGDEYTLLPGTEYWVVVDTGAFTDLQYNPVAPIVKGDFKFTTYGRSCPAYPLGLYDHVEVEYASDPVDDLYAHESEATIRCAANYSPRFKDSDFARLSGKVEYAESVDEQTRVSITCIDGDWDFMGLACLADCTSYQTLGSQYVVEVLKLATDDNDLLPFGAAPSINETKVYKSGSQLKISCAANSETLSGSPLGEIAHCVNGRWTGGAIRCGVTCPPFPDLGRAYTLASIRGSGNSNFAIGSSRTVACNSDALGDRGRTETVVCQEDGTWQLVSLQCYYNCPRLDLAALSQGLGLEPITSALAISKQSKGRAGETYIFQCESGSIPQVDGEGTDPVGALPTVMDTYWKGIDQNFPVAEDRQVQISCVEGQWLRRRQLSCLKSCPPFMKPGPGYKAQLVFGDGVEPGSTYEIQCLPDATVQRRSSKGQADQVVCTKGSWLRASGSLECLGACVNPLTYFGANYKVIDQDSGLALTPVSPAQSASTTYRHHSQSFSVECAPGMQPLDAPLVSDPSLTYLRGKAPLDPDAPVRISDVRPLTGLFEAPSQSVRCHDGEWLPTSPASGGAGLVRCSPYCPPLSSLYSKRYVRTDSDVGFSWGSKRHFTCANDLAGGHVARLDNGTLAFFPRDSVTFQCARGAWLAPPPPLPIPELKLTYSPLKDWLTVKTAHTSIETIQQSVAAALPCGRQCSKSSLEQLVRSTRLRIAKPSRSSITSRVAHGTLIYVQCEVGSSRISGPTDGEAIGCADGEWTLPLLVCGFPSCHDGAINQDETNVDCGGTTCVTPCPENLHSCEREADSCAACSALPDPDLLYTAENSKAGVVGAFITDKDLPLPHGSLLHSHYREFFNLPLTAVSDNLYAPYLCVNGSWEKLQAAKRRLSNTTPGLTATTSAVATTTSSATATTPLSTSTTSAIAVTTSEADSSGIEVTSSKTSSARAGATSSASSTPANFTSSSLDAVSTDNGTLLKQVNGLTELATQIVSCSDGVMSRGEWGIDCGGICPTPCPDCFDRVKNGQEDWVDCGGPCRACNSCALADLKAYDGEAYMLDLVDVDVMTSAVSGPKGRPQTSRPAHGSGLRVSCSSSAVAAGGTLPLDLVCLDGRWWPTSLATEMMLGESDISPADFTALPMYAVRCELRSIYELEKAMIHKFRSPGITLQFCGDEAEPRSTSKFCCPLLASYNREMAGECGTLLYSGGVAGFCQGVCYQRMKQLTEFYDTLKEEAVSQAADEWDSLGQEEKKHLQVCEQVANQIKSISKSFCYTNADGSDSKSNSKYCFAAAGANLSHLKTLDLYTKAADIAISCKKKSCFRSNVHYVDTMWQLIHMAEVRMMSGSHDSRRRVLGGVEAILSDPYLDHLRALQELRPARDHMVALIGALFDAAGGSSAPGRKLAGIVGVAPVIGSIFRDPSSVQYSDTVVPLMCLKDSRGELCTKQFQQMIQTMSLWSGQTAMTAADRVKLGQAVAGLAATCNESSCFLQLSRHLGQEVSERGISRGDPYQRFMGYFLKLFGRYFCQHDAHGSSCAVKYLGWLVQGMQPAPLPRTHLVETEGSVNGDLTRVTDKTSEIRALLHDCDTTKCPLRYVNDGVCDPQCFDEKCGYDGGDCLLLSMYPGIIQRLMRPISLSSICHPLNAQLQACPRDFACHKTISHALINYGCCFAVGVDMLKEVLDLEYYSHPLVRPDAANTELRSLLLEQFGSATTQLASSDFALTMYDDYSPDRSSIYSQTICNLYQDRTCSRGMARRVLAIYFETHDSPSFDALAWMMLRRPPASLRITDFPYSQVDYDDFRTAVEREVPVLRLKVLLRKQLADILVLPSTDIRDVDFWPVQDRVGKQALVEIVVDPSLFVDETKAALQAMQDSGEFQELISATVAQWRRGISPTLERFLGAMEARAGRRRLGAQPAEVDQNKALAVDIDKVRQMPVTRVQRVQFKIITLDPIKLDADGTASDSLPPSDGTFDLGAIAGAPRTCSLRTLVFEHDPWSSAALPFRHYVTASEHGGAITGYDGESIMISCRAPGYAARAGSPEQQRVVCSNGRWISADREPLLECLKPCPHFHLRAPVPEVYRVAGEGQSAGSTRRVSCATGYASTSSTLTSELLTCSDGQWSPLSLQCKRTAVFDGACAGVPLDFLVNNFHFKIGPQTSGNGTTLTLTNAVWWKAVCQRGYEPSSGISPLYLVCLDEQRLLSFGLMSYHLQQKAVKPPSAEGVESALRQFISDSTPTGQLAEVDLARLIWSSELPLKTNTGVTPDLNVTKLVCSETIITKPQLLVESGIDDWAYIGLVAGIAFGATVLFGIWGYYWQTRGRRRRNLKIAKKLAAQQEALMVEPTASEEGPKLAENRNFPITSQPPLRGGAGWSNDNTLQPLPRRDEHSSNGYYSDVEYYIKRAQE